MPITVSYPGVYVEEIPSGNRTIVGVPTSITGFLGRTSKGPIDEPMTVFNFGDFERFYGGLSHDFPLSFSVYDFFLNGGSQAVIARVFQAFDANELLEQVAPALATSLKKATPSIKPDDQSTVITAVENALKGLDSNDKIKAYDFPTEAKKLFTIKDSGGRDIPPESIDALLQRPSIFFAAAKQLIDNPSSDTSSAIISLAPPKLVEPSTEQISSLLLTAIQQQAKSITPKPTALKLQQVVDKIVKDITADSKIDEAKLKTNLADAGLTDQTTPKVGDAAANIAKDKNLLKATESLSDQLTKFKAAPATLATPPSVNPVLIAKTPGSWGNYLAVSIDQNGIVEFHDDNTFTPNDTLAPLVTSDKLKVSDLFNITIYYAEPGKPVASESFTNVSFLKDAGPLRLDRVLAKQSQYENYLFKDISGAELAPWFSAWSQWQKSLSNDPKKSKNIVSVLLPQAGTGNDGPPTLLVSSLLGSENDKTGLHLFDKADLINLLCIPPDSLEEGKNNIDPSVFQAAAVYCLNRRAVLLIDSPTSWTDSAKQGLFSDIKLSDLGNYGEEGRNAAVYFPRIRKPDPLLNGKVAPFAPSGAIAGLIARTDNSRGVWKSPAGLEAGISGIQDLTFKMTDMQNGLFNPVGINCLRTFPTGTVVWGARTLKGADQLSDDYKYLSVRRLTLYIEESLYRGTQWAVFEPNNEALWSQLRLSIGAFMGDLAKQGAFYSYSVKCDSSTTSQYDIDRGIVKVFIGFAPVKPAEFVILQFQQLAGQKPA